MLCKESVAKQGAENAFSKVHGRENKIPVKKNLANCIAIEIGLIRLSPEYCFEYLGLILNGPRIASN